MIQFTVCQIYWCVIYTKSTYSNIVHRVQSQKYSFGGHKLTAPSSHVWPSVDVHWRKSAGWCQAVLEGKGHLCWTRFLRPSSNRLLRHLWLLYVSETLLTLLIFAAGTECKRMYVHCASCTAYRCFLNLFDLYRGANATTYDDLASKTQGGYLGTLRTQMFAWIGASWLESLRNCSVPKHSTSFVSVQHVLNVLMLKGRHIVTCRITAARYLKEANLSFHGCAQNWFGSSETDPKCRTCCKKSNSRKQKVRNKAETYLYHTINNSKNHS